MSEFEIARLLADDAREKRMARGGQAVGKVSPRTLVMPQDLDAAWWRRAPPVVQVRIRDGAVLVFRWPLPEGSTLGSGPG